MNFTSAAKRLIWVLLLLSVLCAPLFALTELPLTDGGRMEVEIERMDENGVTVRQPKGTIRIPWSQISPSFEQHPFHERFLTLRREREARAREEAARAAAQRTGGEPLAANGEETWAAGEILLSPFSKVLLLSFLFFWLQIFCVWYISRENEAGGSAYQAWNLAALIFGLPVLLFFLLRRYGISNPLRRKTKSAATEIAGIAPAEVSFYTWDGEPIKSAARKRVSSGLETARAIIARAAQQDASDIHFDTTTDGVRFAFRVDGVLREPEFLGEKTGRQTMSALKMAAGIDVGKLHETQDGACHVSVRGEEYDMRLARANAVNGETLTVRLLRAGGFGDDLSQLGMLPEITESLQDLVTDTAGIIIMAGPTGSGKTSTIYALLRKVVGTGRNILTIEDPVEYRLDGATQISLNARVNATFAGALKASMRHDPDIILVGEIRDAETMQVAFQAALTGHLVFTALHATSVLATFGRLQELGLSSYMINTGLKAMVCQRLVRLLCPSCRDSYVPSSEELTYWGLSAEESTTHCFYQPVGCRLCADTGYHGRRALYRVLVMNNQVRSLIKPNMATGELQEIIDELAMGKVSQYARNLLWSGETAPDELRKTVDMFDYGKRLGASSKRIPLRRKPAAQQDETESDSRERQVE